MKPYPYQQRVLDNVGGDNALLAMALGTGKTATAIWLSQQVEPVPASVLVVGPIRTFDGWERTLREITGEELRECHKRNKKGKAALEDLFGGAPGWYFCGWEMLRSLNTERRWDGTAKDEINKSVRRPVGGRTFDLVIADEWHRASNAKSQNFQVISRIRAERKLALSATPAGSTPANIWAAYKWLWDDRIPAYRRFAAQYFVSSVNLFATQRNRWGGAVYDYGAEKRPGLVRSLVPHHESVSAEEAYPDMPGVNVVRVPCKMTREQAKIYKSWEADALAWLGENPVAVDIPMHLDMRLRQATLGQVVVSGYVEKIDAQGEPYQSPIIEFPDDAKSSKIDALLGVMSDLPGEKHVVYTHSAKILVPLKARLAKAGYVVAEASGADRDGWRRFRDDPDCNVLVAVIPAVAEGIDGLQKVCHIEHWLSQDNSVVLNEQATGRLHRGGQTKRVTRYLYQCPDTVDTRAVEPRLAEKYNSLSRSGLI